ncbi:LamG domain-containing protein [Candidatus Woesearchaeota archaeon]|nr:LamG domain-containing protein [Candidatus Woesearchaeota archaeon]
MKRGLCGVFVVVALLVTTLVLAAPEINYTTPTPSNNNYTGSLNYTRINATITESRLGSLTYNWNGANFLFYNDSLVLSMNFDNLSVLGENGTTAVDVSRFGNNGTCTNMGTDCNFTASGGRYYGGIMFDGINDFINLGVPTSLQIAQNLTISAWINVYPAGIYPRIVSADQGGVADQGYDLRLFTGLGDRRPAFRLDNGTNVVEAVSPDALVQGRWYHIVAMYTGNESIIYVDGVKKANVSMTGNLDYTNLTSIRIGARQGDNNYFNGTIDEVKIWNRSFSDQEVYQFYASNLRKRDLSTWELYVNQSQNATTGLIDGTYTYYISATNTTGDAITTSTRTVIAGQDPVLVPEWSDYVVLVILGIVVTGFLYLKRD